MKPLLQKDIASFLERFCHFQDGEIVSLSLISPNEIHLCIATQDKKRAFDWIHLDFVFFGIENARLLENVQLQMVDLSEGISLIAQSQKIGLALGKYNSLSTMEDAQFYIIAHDVKYEEKTF